MLNVIFVKENESFRTRFDFDFFVFLFNSHELSATRHLRTGKLIEGTQKIKISENVKKFKKNLNDKLSNRKSDS